MKKLRMDEEFTLEIKPIDKNRLRKGHLQVGRNTGIGSLVKALAPLFTLGLI